MHRYEMTPFRIILNATLYGLVAWAAMFVLQSLHLFVEPFLIAKLFALFGHPQSWHPSNESWFGQLLEFFHPLVIFTAIAYSAVRDFLELRNIRQMLGGKRTMDPEYDGQSPMRRLRNCDSAHRVTITVSVHEEYRYEHGHVAIIIVSAVIIVVIG